MTDLAGHHHVGQEIHLDGLVAVSAAGLAPATAHIKREPARLVCTYLGLRQLHKELANVAENTGICGRIGTRRTAYGRLVHIHHLVYQVNTLNRVICQRFFQGPVELLRQYGLKRLVYQR